MEGYKNFEDVKQHNVEYLPDRSRIYTFIFEDGASESFILTANEISEFLKANYKKKQLEGKVFGPEEFEEKREEFILSIDDGK